MQIRISPCLHKTAPSFFQFFNLSTKLLHCLTILAIPPNYCDASLRFQERWITFLQVWPMAPSLWTTFWTKRTIWWLMSNMKGALQVYQMLIFRPKKSEDRFSSLPRTSSIMQFKGYFQDSFSTTRPLSTQSLSSNDSSVITDLPDFNKTLPKDPRKKSTQFARFFVGLKTATLGRRSYDLESEGTSRRRSSFMNLGRKQSLVRVDEAGTDGKFQIPLRTSSRDVD